MLFNSIDYLLFIPTVFSIYWFITQNNLKIQNIFLLISSYFFYAWWDWRFLFLIFFSTMIDYFAGLKIYSAKNNFQKKLFLWSSIIFNLGLLGFFKYYNFFIDSFFELFSFFGFSTNYSTLQIILPVGISFYTFQTMSYPLDIYFKKLRPTKDFIAFASFVSFFPQLIAGPIERATNLLPQILNSRIFNYEKSIYGLNLILYGMFKKVVIADSLAWRVDYCFENYHSLDGGVLLLGIIYFSIQLYCDFSGYSDIAIGSGKILGFDLMPNFNYPFFSTTISEFWRRWHISLSSWFRDYLFVPLSIKFRDHGRIGVCLAIIITYVIIGLWHGADNKFLIFGFINALYFIPSIIVNIQIDKMLILNNLAYGILNSFRRLRTFILFSVSLIFFRSPSTNEGFEYLKQTLLTIELPSSNKGGIVFVALLMILENVLYNKNYPFLHKAFFYENKRTIYYGFLFISALVITMFSAYNEYYLIDKPHFIYFQF